MSRPRGFAPWNPKAAGRVLVYNVEVVLDDYADYLPMTIRQIFYRLVVAGQIDKTERGYKRLCEHLNRARRAGMIPMSSIRDDGTTVKAGYTYENESDLRFSLQYYAKHADFDLQKEQPQRLELWCEAAGMVPQLQRIAEPYGIGVTSSGGFDSVTGKYNAAKRFEEHLNGEIVVLHVGDYDPSGVHIYNSLMEDVTAFSWELGGPVLTFERLLVLPEQIERYDLPTAPPKRSDNRRFDDHRTVQAEAFDPATMAQIIEAAIIERTDPDILKDAYDEQTAVRRRVAGALTL